MQNNYKWCVNEVQVRSFCLVADVKRAYRSWTTPSPFALCRQSALCNVSLRSKKCCEIIKQIETSNRFFALFGRNKRHRSNLNQKAWFLIINFHLSHPFVPLLPLFRMTKIASYWGFSRSIFFIGAFHAPYNFKSTVMLNLFQHLF